MTFVKHALMTTIVVLAVIAIARRVPYLQQVTQFAIGT